MKNKLFASVPNILFGALITIAPQTFAHACTGHDMPGACHYSQITPEILRKLVEGLR